MKKFIIFLTASVFMLSCTAQSDTAPPQQLPSSEIWFTESSDPHRNPMLLSEIRCLAENLYFESKSESERGQRAVAYVTLNRVMSDRYPDTICGVVKEGRISKWWLKTHGKVVPVRHQCQFSWYCDGKSDTIRDEKVFQKMLDLALEIVYNYHVEDDITNGALWYHADYVDPYWNKQLQKTVKIDTHIFYKDPSYDEKVKPEFERREVIAFVLSSNGGN